GKDGKNVNNDNLEMTRLMRKLKPKYEGKTAADFTNKEDKKELEFYLVLKDDFKKTLDKFEGGYNQLKFLYEGFTGLDGKVKSELGVEKVTYSDLEKYKPSEKQDVKIAAIAMNVLKNSDGASLEEVLKDLKGGYEQYKSFVEYGLNLEFDPREIVGDDYNNSSERYYGNNDCNGPNSFHGTHAAGIIAASRNNGIGMDGIAADVRIMAIRCVPDGDERDKDVANSIRYAVDNGAKII